MAGARPGRHASSRVLLTLGSAFLSVMVHGGVLAAAFFLIEDTPGAIDLATEAISLELYQTEVLEAVAPSLEQAASLAAVEQAPGEAVESPAMSKSAKEVEVAETTTEVAAPRPQDDRAAHVSEGLEVLQGTVESDEAIGQEKAIPKQVQKEIQEPIANPKPAKPIKAAKLTDPDEQPREAESAARKKGGAASRASKGAAASPARVSASSGSAVNYAAQVRARVASRKPSGGGQRGTVVVSFGVTRSGGLSYASIARSSGNPSLDRTVLSAVRSAAPFPAPPPGAQLRFAVPFYFR